MLVEVNAAVEVIAAAGAAGSRCSLMEALENCMQGPNRNRSSTMVAMFLTVAGTLFATIPARAVEGHSFASPQAAIDALVAAVKSGYADEVAAVLGPKGRDLASSGDPVADETARQRFISAYDESHELKLEGSSRAILRVGKDDFPFPIPIVEDAGAWHFDTKAGAEEILDRRIGENELAAIKVLRAYVDAQHEYAEADHDGKGVQYAQRLVSSDGKQDGLYWPATGDAESPLGPLVGEARAEGYKAHSDGPHPYHGYLFRILTSQGKDAAGGERDYVIGGRMLGGFGLVATPAEYGNSGVMTFIVNQDGILFQKDLGPDTSELAPAMRSFNPDGSWAKVSD